MFALVSLICPIQTQAYETSRPIYFEAQTLTPVVSQKPLVLAIVDHPTKPAPKKLAKSKTPNSQGNYGGYCVEFAKKYLGLNGTWGYGGKLLPLNTKNPQVGDVVVFYGHVAVIIGITADGMLTLIESNYHLDRKITVGRQIAKTDLGIHGFYHPIRN